MEIKDLELAIEGILFASGEPVAEERLAAVLAVDQQTISAVADHMAAWYEDMGRGIRLRKLDGSLQLCSAPEISDVIRLALETRAAPRLSQTSLEVLAIIAYYQPVTRAYIERVRGVDSSHTVSLLMDKGLVETRGRLNAPGRPTLFGTTMEFLRVFGISALDELPELPDTNSEDEGQIKIRKAIDSLIQEEKFADSADGALS